MNTVEHLRPAPRLLRMVHPLDLSANTAKAAQSKQVAASAEQRNNCNLSLVKQNDTTSSQKDESAVQIRPNGTVVTFNEDGSRSEIRPNGTIIAYFADGSIKFFRTGCWSG